MGHFRKLANNYHLWESAIYFLADVPSFHILNCELLYGLELVEGAGGEGLWQGHGG
jgi:hypothetical protein